MRHRLVSIWLSLGSWVCLTLLVASAASLVIVARSGSTSPPTAQRLELRCLERSVIDTLRTDLGRFTEVADRCQAELESLPWPAGARDVVLAAAIAHRFAPYGEHDARTIEEMLTSDHLACYTYAVLTLALLPDDIRSKTWALGFEAGAVGNHAQLRYADGDLRLLVDPTVGLIAEIGFNDLLLGQRPKRTVDVSRALESQHIARFHDRVKWAVGTGQYKPRDLLYVYDDFDLYAGLREPGPGDQFLTPGGVWYREHQL